MNYHFFICHSWYTSNFETTYKKPPFIKIANFFWCSFSIKLSWLQRRSNKINTIQRDRYYLQNCKVITFEKIAIHRKYKKPNVPQFPSSFSEGNKFSKEYCLEEWVISFCVGCDDKNLGASFEWRGYE